MVLTPESSSLFTQLLARLQFSIVLKTVKVSLSRLSCRALFLRPKKHIVCLIVKCHAQREVLEVIYGQTCFLTTGQVGFYREALLARFWRAIDFFLVDMD